MDSTQDNRIREKINSLNSLPDGYLPSLDSKWELLQQARQPKKKPVGVWYTLTAAACFLLMLGFGWLLLQTGQKQPVPLATNTSKITVKARQAKIRPGTKAAAEKAVAAA